MNPNCTRITAPTEDCLVVIPRLRCESCKKRYTNVVPFARPKKEK